MMEMTMKGATSTANMYQACSIQWTIGFVFGRRRKNRGKRLVGAHTTSEKGSQCGVEGNDRAHARWDEGIEISAIRGKWGRERRGFCCCCCCVVSSWLLLHASSLMLCKRAAMHAPAPLFPSGCRQQRPWWYKPLGSATKYPP